MHSILLTGASALVLLATSAQAKNGVHEHLEAIHRRHRLEREAARQANETLVKRGTCTFPTNAGLVAVTPNSGNGGWAFAPDQTCTPGRYCPYACPPGQVSMQWDPSVTSYEYPGSRNGGLLCNSDGTVTKPFPNRPYCQSTSPNIGVQNNCGGNVAFCQTVLPGDEDMLIPTVVTGWSKLAVPDPSYWASTAAHYYINPPGVSSSQGCIWGSTSNPHGNWAPYVAGANTDSTGQTYIKLGWNPIYLEKTTPFRNEMPSWGVRIECPDGGCTGLPCAIDPVKNKVNEMTGSSSIGAGDAAFCVVTVAKGLKANFVVFSENESTTSSTTTCASTTASPSGWSGWSKWSNANVKSGGRFYQSAGGTMTEDVNGTSSTITAPAGSPTLDESSNAGNSTNSLDGPNGQPYFQLFDASTAAAPTTTDNSPQATSKPLVAQHTGGASLTEASLAALMFSLGAMLVQI